MTFDFTFGTEADFSLLLDIVELLSKKNSQKIAIPIAAIYKKLIESLIVKIKSIGMII